MKIIHNIYFACLFLFFSVIIFCIALFHYGLSQASDNSDTKIVVIEPGSVDSIANTLEKEHLIKSKIAFKIYVRLSGKANLKAATYTLSENMGTKKIVEILYNGTGENSNQIAITFKEGINMRKVVKKIAENTNCSEASVYEVINDTEYLKSLMDEYWFLDNSILNKEIYYSLEGYLYPNTYYFSSKEVNVKEIIETMLDETGKQLSIYKEQLTQNSMSIHEILTLASIIELEGATLEDRKGIAGVFLNRINANMNLGSDVTTYYGAKIEIGERDLTKTEVNECNQYNTRCANFAELPVSPICNPSIDSIVAVLEPTISDNYYFVADKNKKIYFSKNITEHNKTIEKLKKEALWYEY